MSKRNWARDLKLAELLQWQVCGLSNDVEELCDAAVNAFPHYLQRTRELEETIRRLQAAVDAAWAYRVAHVALEAAVADFDLQNAQVETLKAAAERLDKALAALGFHSPGRELAGLGKEGLLLADCEEEAGE